MVTVQITKVKWALDIRSELPCEESRQTTGQSQICGAQNCLRLLRIKRNESNQTPADPLPVFSLCYSHLLSLVLFDFFFNRPFFHSTISLLCRPFILCLPSYRLSELGMEEAASHLVLLLALPHERPQRALDVSMTGLTFSTTSSLSWSSHTLK